MDPLLYLNLHYRTQLNANESIQSDVPGSKKLDSTIKLDSADRESRFCLCLAYFHLKVFSEMYFSAPFCLQEKVC